MHVLRTFHWVLGGQCVAAQEEVQTGSLRMQRGLQNIQQDRGQHVLPGVHMDRTRGEYTCPATRILDSMFCQEFTWTGLEVSIPVLL